MVESFEFQIKFLLKDGSNLLNLEFMLIFKIKIRAWKRCFRSTERDSRKCPDWLKRSTMAIYFKQNIIFAYTFTENSSVISNQIIMSDIRMHVSLKIISVIDAQELTLILHTLIYT